MSRLVNPGLGDQLDRLTILALKILHKGAQEHWVRERNALLAQVRTRNGVGAALEALVELAAVNGALWQAEDDLRALRIALPVGNWDPADYRTDAAADAARAGVRIQDLNDRRAALVDQINALVGDDRGAEKG